MEKDIGKLTKNNTTDVVIRVDDFGGKRGLTIREFVTSDRYTGFTKAGTRIAAENFPKFKEMINSVDEKEMAETPEGAEEAPQEPADKDQKLDAKVEKPGSKEDLPDY